jgi:hypothetical protein
MSLNRRPPETHHLSADLDTLQRIVGGNLEAVDLPEAGAHAYCNEEGKLLGLPVNLTATGIIDRLQPGFARRDLLCGDVGFLGTGPGGEEADVPPTLLAVITPTT